MSYECSQCPRTFRSNNAAWQHMNDKNHFQFECHVCCLTYPTHENRHNHEGDYHNRHFCDDCHREFKSRNGLNMHMKSHAHVGRNMACPFCKNNFATATGITHHIERGGCPNVPDMDRDSLWRFMRSKDPNGIFSKNLLDWHGSTQYEASGRSWNGSAFECYLCPREFNSLHGLNQHLSSPIHQQALYHCPKAGCQKDFTTLAALINHFESESCGFLQFRQVQNGIEGLIKGNRLLM